MATIRCQGHTFENIAAVLFDKDGTLANVEEYLLALGWARSHQVDRQFPGLAPKLAAAMGITDRSIDPTGLMAIASRQENEIAVAAYVAATGMGWTESRQIVTTAFSQVKEQLATQYAQPPLIAGAKSLITRLKLAGVKVGIVSADTHLAVHAFIIHHRLSSVDWYCGEFVANPPKTHPEFLSFACEAIASQPAQTLIIGDSGTDWNLAKQGAAGFIGMVGGWQTAPKIAGAEIVIQQLDQVECFN